MQGGLNDEVDPILQSSDSLSSADCRLASTNLLQTTLVQYSLHGSHHLGPIKSARGLEEVQVLTKDGKCPWMRGITFIRSYS